MPKGMLGNAETLRRLMAGPLSDFLVKCNGEEGEEWERQFARFLRKEPTWNCGGRTLVIDRSRPFDPAKFIGRGWTTEEQDERSLSLTKIDLAAIVLEVSLKNGERSITGEENLKRLKKANHIRLDVAVFLALWENQHLIPESWKGKYVFFDGTVLRNSRGNRFALYLYWRSDRWHWYYHWLGHDRFATDPSAVLAS